MVNVKECWDFHFSEPILGIEIGDINNNDQNEITLFSKSGKLHVISLSGKKITEIEISDNSPIWHSKICDIDRDNKNEIVLGGLDGLLRTFKCSTSYELHPFWAHQFGASISGFLYEDITNDGINEIMAYSIDKSIRCLNSVNGSLIWGQLFEDGVGDAIVWQGTINSSGKEVLACGNDGTIRSFNGENGELYWFKRFEDKIRCISSIKSNTKEMIACGGDDKILHVIDKNTKEELKSLYFKDFVWKCSSFMLEKQPYLTISTYSFDFFDKTREIEDIEFSSKLLCLNFELEKKWEINNVNVETIIHLELFSKKFIIIGTTKGKILIIDTGSGKIATEINKNSCINDLKYDPESNLLISCHDNGSVFAYFLGKS